MTQWIQLDRRGLTGLPPGFRGQASDAHCARVGEAAQNAANVMEFFAAFCTILRHCSPFCGLFENIFLYARAIENEDDDGQLFKMVLIQHSNNP